MKVFSERVAWVLNGVLSAILISDSDTQCSVLIHNRPDHFKQGLFT